MNNWFNFKIPFFNEKFGNDWLNFKSIVDSNVDNVMNKTFDLYKINDISTKPLRALELSLQLRGIPSDASESLGIKRKRLRSYNKDFKSKGMKDTYLDYQESVVGVRGEIYNGYIVGSFVWGISNWHVEGETENTNRVWSTDGTRFNIYINPKYKNETVESIVESTLMFYSFDDPTNIAKDDSGNGFNGTPTDITWTGGVANFNGTSSRIVVNPSPVVNLTGHTIRFKFKRDGIPSGVETIATLYFDGANRPFIVARPTTGRIGFQNVVGGSFSTERSTLNNLCDNQWHDVVIKFIDSTSLQFIVDGNAEAVQTITVPLSNISGSLRIGARNLDNFLNGQLSQFSLYNRALTPEEITYLYEKSMMDEYYNVLDELVDVYRQNFLLPAFYKIYLVNDDFKILRTV